MSRARNIKPGFFKNDRLAECDPLARILFQGLWCEADREGRLEDRPKRLKAECLPYDDCDIEALLSQLVERDFIVRYVVDGKAYIAIPQFAKHQNPHVKEAESTIPAPCKPGAKTERAGLIPDSPFPLTDSSVAAKPRTFARWVESLNGEQAIPADHPVFAYAGKVGVPADFLALAWAWFEKTYGSGGSRAAKKYKDWPQVFQNAVEGGWPKLWYFDNAGECKLNAAGLQLQRELAA